MLNAKKYINDSKSGNINKDFNINQLKTTNVYKVPLVSITPVDFDTFLNIFDQKCLLLQKFIIVQLLNPIFLLKH